MGKTNNVGDTTRRARASFSPPPPPARVRSRSPFLPAAWHDGRTFYYWVNEDKFSGDRIDEGFNLVPNAWDFTVNGTFDLVNFFPVALDLSAFTAAWQGRVTYTVKPKWGAVNCCSCPDHRTNYVGVTYKSYRLRLVDANGLPFRSSGEPA